MSLRPDDRARNRDRSSTRRERSRSNVRVESPARSSYGGDYEIRAPERPSVPYPEDDDDYSRNYGRNEYDRDDRYRDDRNKSDRYGRDDRDDKYNDRSYGRDDRNDRGTGKSGRDKESNYGRDDRDDKYGRNDKMNMFERDSHVRDDRYGRDDRPNMFQRDSHDRDDRHGRDDRPNMFQRDSHDKHSQSNMFERDSHDRDDKYRKYSKDDRDDKYARAGGRDDRNRRDSSDSESGLNYGRDRDQPRYQEVRPDDSYSHSRHGSVAGYAPQDPYQYAKVDKIKYTSKPQAGFEQALVRTTSNSLTPTMDRLSISGQAGHSMSGGRPPASPLLEAYHGTYQSISPMPTALRLDDDEIPSLDSVQPKREKKKVKLYDPEADAKALAKALNTSRPDTEVICDILPPLSDDQVYELRKEYKKQYKVQGKGINLSKLLKMKLSGNFGKVVYVTALGRWESEGYWANFFYQSHASRRELLIESLMGRTNAEIRSIKNEFKDKRYNDDLVRCMEKELKMDKFRSAILMALEGRRQEEQDVYPHEYRAKDVENLQRCVRAREGGETAMLEIVIRRSDAHLRECLRLYESMYGDNFARAALKKSNNLVGEVIAHILNGVINKPARDALLLRHAIKDIANHNKDDELRYELLTSRLVRLHWDRLHMMRVKKEYRDKYGKYLEEDLEDSTKGDFREFVCELCQVQGPK